MPPMGSLGRMLGRGVAGAGLGAAAMTGYNALEGRDLNTGVAKAMAYGAGAWLGKGLLNKGGWAGAKSAFGNASSVKLGKNLNIGGRINDWSQRASSAATKFGMTSTNKYVNKYASKLGARNISAAAFGMARGGMYGAAGGAAYGAFSDRETMISGAMKGAMAGALGHAAFNLNKMHNFVKIPGLGMNRSVGIGSMYNNISYGNVANSATASRMAGKRYSNMMRGI